MKSVEKRKTMENMENKTKELSLEDSFEQLDALLEKLEDRKLPLETAFVLYQQGVELLKNCSGKIDLVEKKILMMTGDGEFEEF